MKPLRELMKDRIEKTRFWFIEGVSFTSEELARSREPLEIDDQLMSSQLVERLKIAIRSKLARFADEPIEEELPVTVQETSLDLGDGDTRHVVCVELDGGTLDGFGWMLLLPDPEKVHEAFSRGMVKFVDDTVKEFRDCVAEQMLDNEDAVVTPTYGLLRHLPYRDSTNEVASQYKCFVETCLGHIDEAHDLSEFWIDVTTPDGSELQDRKNFLGPPAEVPKFEDLMKDKLIEWQMEQDLSQGLLQ